MKTRSESLEIEIFGEISIWDFLKWNLSLKFTKYLPYGGGLRVRDTTLTNHWNICMHHCTSISCKHRSNLDRYHSFSKENFKGFLEIEYDANISLISRVMSFTLGLPPQLNKNFSLRRVTDEIGITVFWLSLRQK